MGWRSRLGPKQQQPGFAGVGGRDHIVDTMWMRETSLAVHPKVNDRTTIGLWKRCKASAFAAPYGPLL